MANQEHLERLAQGAKPWNAWRERNQAICPDLSRADLRSADLRYANLRSTNLKSADLGMANLSHADLSDTDLSFATLISANLSFANLTEARLGATNLTDANLNSANLAEARLSGAILYGTRLSGANLQRTFLWETIWAGVDLRATKGLAEVIHQGPSSIVLSTIKLPSDGSALHFLQGTGAPDEWIDFYRSAVMKPIQYHSCFISYSNKDELLATRLHADLQAQGVRCWFAPEDMKIGDKIRARIDEAIHLQEKLLLLLSEHALASDWVEIEVETALAKEKAQHREVLFPVRLDESVMTTSQVWAKHLRHLRHIGDFTNWTDPRAYLQAFERLLRDLRKATGDPEK